MAKRMAFVPPWGPYIEVEDTPPTGSAAPQFIGAPPRVTSTDEDDPFSSNATLSVDMSAPKGGAAPGGIHKDEAGVLRNDYGSRPQPAPSGGGSGGDFGGGSGGGFGGDGGGFGGGGWSGGGFGGGSRGFTGTVAVGRLAPQQGTMGGGGGDNMAFSQSVGGGIRTQYSSLDPNAWGQNPTSTLQQVGTAAQGAVNAGDSLMGVNPQVGAAPRTLYDRYQGLLMDPSSMMQDKNVGFMLDQAQDAARRQLAAGRMRHSGNALTELAQVTSGNLMGQFRNLADVYRGGADTEFGRWQGETGAGLDAARIRAGALGSAAQAYVGAGQLGTQSAATVNDRAKLDLARVQAGIASPQEEYLASQQAYQRALGWNEQVYAGQRGPSPFGVGVSNLYTQGQLDALRPASTYQNWVNSNWGGSPHSGYGAGQGYSYRGYGL